MKAATATHFGYSKTIISINTTESLLSAKPLAPSFEELHIWGAGVHFSQSHKEDIRLLAPILLILCTGVHSLLVQCGILRNVFPWQDVYPTAH